jgi:hypothetical protein
MSGWESELIKQAMLELIPDDGTWHRRLRRWNVRHNFVITFALWWALVVLVCWLLWW